MSEVKISNQKQSSCDHDKESDQRNGVFQPAKNVVNLGCRLNIYEGNVISEILKNSGMQEDCIVINTCAVTKEAERQSRQTVRRMKRENPGKKIIVTGCASQINPEQFSNMAEVDKVIGNDIKTNQDVYKTIQNQWSEALFVENTEKILVNDIMSITETANHLIPASQDRTRAFLQVQNGCNHRCTFCIIPYGRGNSRSVPVAQVISSVQEMVNSGYNEIVLTGVDITDYGLDLPGKPCLGFLCKRILSQTSIKRLRLSSIDVAEVDEDLKDLICHEKRFMPYFHISLQSGDDLILKRMKRRHNRNQVIEFCDFVRKHRQDAGFGADIICGFPTENDEMFNNTLNLAKECKIAYIHSFSYSARSGTPASKMPQVLLKIRQERNKILTSLGENILAEFLQSMVGTKQEIILEISRNGGRAENFAKVIIENPDKIPQHFKPGDVLAVNIIGSEKDCLIGKVEQF